MVRPERRSKADVVAAATIAVVVAATASLIWWTSDARATISRPAAVPAPRLQPARWNWRASAAAVYLLVRHDAYAVCDEVYEHLTFDGWRHIPLMTLPGLRDRVMRIGSAGKTFSLTGWKVGYVTAPAALASVVAKAHQNLTFTTPPNLQRAVAHGLGKDDSYFDNLGAALQAKRDRLAEGLAGLGFGVLPTNGSYFLTTDFSPLGFAGDDRAFCRHITEQAGVTAIPVSAFYDQPDAPRHYARFAFCKREAVLDEAVTRLRQRFGAQTLTAAG